MVQRGQIVVLVMFMRVNLNDKFVHFIWIAKLLRTRNFIDWINYLVKQMPNDRVCLLMRGSCVFFLIENCGKMHVLCVVITGYYSKMLSLSPMIQWNKTPLNANWAMNVNAGNVCTDLGSNENIHKRTHARKHLVQNIWQNANNR